MAITRTRPPGWRSTAGLRAGSVPMIGRSGYVSRRNAAAAEVAVLQAMTMALTPRARSHAAASALRACTSWSGAISVGRVAGIAVVEEVLPGHPVAQRPQHADAAQSRIKNADGVRTGHGVHLFLSNLQKTVISPPAPITGPASGLLLNRCQRPVSPPHYTAAGKGEQENFTRALQNSGWIVTGNVL